VRGLPRRTEPEHERWGKAANPFHGSLSAFSPRRLRDEWNRLHAAAQENASTLPGDARIRRGAPREVPGVSHLRTTLGARATPRPEHRVLAEDGRFELREYPDLVLAETVTDGAAAPGDAFRRLLAYLRGANAGEQGLAMTVPVLHAEAPDGLCMAFVLPAGLRLASAPTPSDPAVELRLHAGRRVACVRFGGAPSRADVAERERELRAWMAARGLAAGPIARRAAYDPPFTPPLLRRNEVWIDVR
jgi:hypothetical protein